MTGSREAQRGSPAAQIRRATRADADAISAVLRLAFAPHRADYTDTAWEVATPDEQTVVARLAEGPTWVAESDGEIVATLSAVAGDEVTLRSLAVLPGAQRNGIAVTLMQAAHGWAVMSGRRSLSLETAAFLESAVRLYGRLGFVPDEGRDLFGVCTVRMTRSTTGPWPDP